MDRILVTGSSGFIGMNLCRSLLEDRYIIAGIDNMNNYYDVSLKEARLNILSDYSNFTFYKVDISNLEEVEKIFKEFKPQKVVNLAAQAGVRYSLENPFAYIESNIVGFINIIESTKPSKVIFSVIPNDAQSIPTGINASLSSAPGAFKRSISTGFTLIP